MDCDRTWMIWMTAFYLSMFASLNDCEEDIRKSLITEFRYHTLNLIITSDDVHIRTDEHYYIDILCHWPTDWGFPLSIPTQNVSDRVTEIHISITNCVVPNITLVETFKNSNMNVDLVKGIRLVNSAINATPSNYNAGTHLRYIELSNVKNFNASEDFFKDMHDLRKITVERMEVPQLPPSSQLVLETLILNKATVTRWDNCQYLKELTITGLTKTQIPTKWPTNCTKLVTLTLDSLDPETTKSLADSFEKTALVNIESLAITSCSLKKLPLPLIVYSKHLKELDLSNNQLDFLEFITPNKSQFPILKDLKILKLANNKLKESFLANILPLTPSLQELNLTDNHIWAHRLHYKDALAISNLTSLERLYFDGQAYDKHSFMRQRFSKLEYFSWRNWDRTVKVLWLDALPSTKNSQLTVDLRGTSVEYLGVGGSKKIILGTALGPDFVEKFENEDLQQLWLTSKGYKLIVLLDSVDCDCNNDVLARALRMFPHFLSMPNLKCSKTDRLFENEPMEKLFCRKAIVNGCIRRISRDYNYTTDVDCSNNAEEFRWPKPQGFHGLNASKNNIQSLKNAYLPDTLEWLDLRNNNISNITKDEATKLFARRRRVWLGNNSIICDCNNQPFLEALQRNQSMVEDYDTLTCAESNQLMRLVDVAALCKVKLDFLWATLNVIAVLTTVIVLLLRYYWNEIKVQLYARGCCLWCLHEEDLDKDRPYDAFISFAHGDNEFVMEKLVPRMESEPLSYRLCVHFRDWLIGEWIPAQIMHSVRSSKRTVIVLSQNFVRSWWGVLEFRFAHANSIAEGRSRLLVLVLDDVLDEDLSPELLGYLKQNTYLRFDDPWFWDKLQYAMPHVKYSRKRSLLSTVSVAESTQPLQDENMSAFEMSPINE